MQSPFAVAAFSGALLLALPAQAEQKIFVITNNADAYGVDRCLARNEKCGRAVANAYCQSQSFKEAASFRKVERAGITGAVPTKGKEACTANCDEFVAITCSR